MARFTERMDAIRAAAQAVAPPDSYVVLSENLSHLGNGTFCVSIREDCPACEGEPCEEGCERCEDDGRSTGSHTLASVMVKPLDDLATIGAQLKAAR